MVSRVLLPDPLGPITATSSPGVDREVDVAQGVHLGRALAVDLGHLAQLEGGHRRTPTSLGNLGRPVGGVGRRVERRPA